VTITEQFLESHAKVIDDGAQSKLTESQGPHAHSSGERD